MRAASLILLLLLLTGCAKFGQRESTAEIYGPDGKVVGSAKLRCQSDGKMTYRQGDIEVTVDNRGRQSFMEQFMGLFMLRFSRVDE